MGNPVSIQLIFCLNPDKKIFVGQDCLSIFDILCSISDPNLMDAWNTNVSLFPVISLFS